MLDQNTDRMWYVIGAVIVGAAIIFLANGTMPEIFASVADTFHKATATATSGVTAVTGPRKNYLLDTSAPRSTTGQYIDYDLRIEDFEELRGETVTLSFDARSETSAEQDLDVYFRAHDSGTALTDLIFELSDGYRINDSYQRYIYTATIPDFSSVAEYPLSIRFRRNFSSGSGFVHHVDAIAAGHESINGTDPYTVRRVKLEIGLTDTEYTEYGEGD